MVRNDGGFDVLGSHTYLEEINTPTSFTVSVSDTGGAPPASGTIATATVADAALTAGTLTPPAATEGIAFTNRPVFHFTDTDPNGTAADYTAVVQLGDGNSVTLSSVTGANGQIVASGDGYDVQLSYTYAEEIKAAANATFSVSVSDAGGAAAISASSRFTVADAALTITSVTHPTAVEGQAISGAVLAHFTDADPNGTVSDYTATITWADGQTSPGTVVVNDGGFDVLGSHTYLEEIITAQSFTVSVSDAGGASVSGTITTATVADAALGGSSAAVAGGTEGATNSSVLSGATFTDANPGDHSGDMTAVD